MVAYNFQKQFVEPIRSRVKKQTIRAAGKRRHATPGEQVQLYTGMRTKSCRKIIEQDPQCITCCPILFTFENKLIAEIQTHLNGDWETVPDLNAFAKADGFKSFEAMQEFWTQFHGTNVPWAAFLIKWDWVDEPEK